MRKMLSATTDSLSHISIRQCSATVRACAPALYYRCALESVTLHTVRFCCEIRSQTLCQTCNRQCTGEP